MDGVRDIGWTELPCNFVQIMENAVDPHHTEWLHGRFFEFMAGTQGLSTHRRSFGKKHVKVGFDAFERGIIKRRLVEGASEEDDDWKIGHPLVFPYNMRVGGANIEQCRSGCRWTGPPPGSCSIRCTRLSVWSTPTSRRYPTTRSRCITRMAGTGWTTSRVRT